MIFKIAFSFLPLPFDSLFQQNWRAAGAAQRCSCWHITYHPCLHTWCRHGTLYRVIHVTAGLSYPSPHPKMSSLRPWDNKGHVGCFFTLWNTPGETFPGRGMLTMTIPSRARIAGLHDKTLLKAIPFTTAICLPWISCLSLPTYGEWVEQSPRESRSGLVKHTKRSPFLGTKVENAFS